MDRLHTMQTFVRVVEAGSFSAVAKEAGATQSAVSKTGGGAGAHPGDGCVWRRRWASAG